MDSFSKELVAYLQNIAASPEFFNARDYVKNSTTKITIK